MVNRNLIRELDLGDELEQEIDLAMGGSDAADFDVGQAPSLAINSVVEGKILRVDVFPRDVVLLGDEDRDSVLCRRLCKLSIS